MASVWEMQIKHELGELPLPGNPDEIWQHWMQPHGAKPLSIEFQHFGKLYDLPKYHRNPFDRILIAQALSEGMAIVSADSAFRHYSGLPVIWE